MTDVSEPYVPPMTDNDLSAIRSRYLGVDKKKRKIRKMNDRKFVFDWDEQDDTYSAEAPAAVGSNRQGAQINFGRGHIAGMDDGGGMILGKGRAVDGGMQVADALERRKAQKAGLDERHWTEKSLEEMKERDWRIFREDFSIAARGLSTIFISLGLFLAGKRNLYVNLFVQVVKYLIPLGLGPSQLSHLKFSKSSRRLVTRNHRLSNGRLFQLVFRNVMLLASQRQVRCDIRRVLFICCAIHY